MKKTFKHYVSDQNTVQREFNSQLQLQMKLCQKAKAFFCVAKPDFEKN